MKWGRFASDKNRKGISSIVGGIFFLVLMTAGFTVYYVALDSQSQMLDTQQIIANTQVAKIQENFVVAASSDPADNYRLSLQVVNTGNNPIEVADIWIINKTDSSQPATRYDIDYRDSSIPVGYGGDILSNTALYLEPEIYDIKVVSALGTIKTVEFDVNGGSNVLKAQMVAIPQDVRFGENVTVGLIVTNAGIDPVTQVSANNLDVVPNQCHDPPNGIFLGPTDLLPSQSTMFFWDCVLDPPIGNVITFTGNATGKLKGVNIHSNDATDSVIVRDFTSGVPEEIVLKDELFGKPQIFMMMPNAVGNEDTNPHDRPFWGVMVANPTDQDMYVTKVVITAISPRDTANDKVFKKKCEEPGSVPEKPVTISPTPDRWSCIESNQIMWKDLDTPQLIEPRSVFPFLVAVGADNMGSSIEDTIHILIQPIVFTTLGQFSKASYGTTMYSDDVALPNVFLARNPNSVNHADIIGEIRGIIEGTTLTLNATFADMSNDPDHGINIGSKLIINIPKDWTFNGPICPTCYNGFNSPTVNPFPDGSTQIVGVLNTSIDTQNEAKSIQFSVTAPSVSTAKMYVMHILADGTATGEGASESFTIGPLAETVLQVCPTSGCP